MHSAEVQGPCDLNSQLKTSDWYLDAALCMCKGCGCKAVPLLPMKHWSIAMHDSSVNDTDEYRYYPFDNFALAAFY